MEFSIYTSKQIERGIFAANIAVAGLVIVCFALLFGFASPMIPTGALNFVQALVVIVFCGERFMRLYMARSKRLYLRGHWFEFALLGLLLVLLFRAGAWENSAIIRQVAIGIYLAFQTTAKLARRTVSIASKGKNPVGMMLCVFGIMIVLGTLFLMLPASGARGRIGFVDAVFTATSAVTVTGLTVKSTAVDVSLFGQHIILVLMQLGGLSIVIFGVVLAFMAGQVFSIKEKTFVGDILSLDQFGHTGKVVTFILVTTVLIELAGTLLLLNSWGSLASGTYSKWFYSVFYSVSAFCNGGFDLMEGSLSPVRDRLSVYFVICPLIILGGMGFGVMYNVGTICKDIVSRMAKRIFSRDRIEFADPRRRLQLQSKIVLVTTLLLVVVPAFAFLVFENNMKPSHDISFTSVQENIFGPGARPQPHFGFLESIFVSVSARTAGFSTSDVGALSSVSLALLMVLMFIGGSPASAAGGIKTVTFAIIIMAAWATVRKRGHVEMFRRSVTLAAVGRSLVIVLLFAATIMVASSALAITERHNTFTLGQIMFETTSAMTTSGLSTGITPTLTTAGKGLIICTMLAGRLGPLALLAFMTLNLKPARYSYPEEPVMVG